MPVNVLILWQAQSKNLPNQKSVWVDIDDVKIETDRFISLFELKSKEAPMKVGIETLLKTVILESTKLVGIKKFDFF